MPADPPLVGHYLLEQPLPTVAALLLLTGLLALAAMRRGHKGLLIGSLIAGPLLAACVWAAATLVATAREQVMHLTKELGAATSPLDPAALDRLLDGDAVLLGPEGGTWLTRTQFDPTIRLVLDRYTISSNQTHVLGADVVGQKAGGQRARVLIDVATRFDSDLYGQRPILTRWLIEWVRPGGSTGPNAWQVIRVRWLEHPGAAAVQPHREVWSHTD